MTLPPGELLTREGDATDEMFVLKSGVVRLVKSLKTSQTFRWPTDKKPDDDDSFSFSMHGDPLSGLKGPVEFKRAPALSASGREIIDSALKMPSERQVSGFTPLERRESLSGRRGSVDGRRLSLRRGSDANPTLQGRRLLLRRRGWFSQDTSTARATKRPRFVFFAVHVV